MDIYILTTNHSFSVQSCMYTTGTHKQPNSESRILLQKTYFSFIFRLEVRGDIINPKKTFERRYIQHVHQKSETETDSLLYNAHKNQCYKNDIIASVRVTVTAHY